MLLVSLGKSGLCVFVRTHTHTQIIHGDNPPHAAGRVVDGRKGLRLKQSPSPAAPERQTAELPSGDFLQLTNPRPAARPPLQGARNSPRLPKYLKHFIWLNYNIYTHYTTYNMHNMYNLTGEEASFLFLKNYGYYIYKKISRAFFSRVVER